MKLYYSPAYVSSEHAFDTTRKAAWIADSLAAAPIPGVELHEPTSLTTAQVALVHDPGYIRAVETGQPRGLAQSQGFSWDKGLWPMVLASNGGVVAAALTALQEGVAGSLSSGLHHARRDSGCGFCTFNGLAIAAYEALAAGARSVLILDLDAHCGGGTASIIADNARIVQADVSVSSMDDYDPTDRAMLAIVRRGVDYIPAVERMLNSITQRRMSFDLCLYNAGMDPFENCSIGGLPGITREVLAQRERMVFDWCRDRDLPIAFVMAGGDSGFRLSQDDLVSLHRLTLASAVDRK
jgi:acetoin utilization deacetylase AcuC-like enzyme